MNEDRDLRDYLLRREQRRENIVVAICFALIVITLAAIIF